MQHKLTLVGPAAIADDGLIAGACLDRFGLRPVRYQLFDDDYFVLASEIGVLDRANITIKKEGRLAPAEIFYVDLSTGHLHFDKHIKEKLAKNADYQKAVTKKHLPLPYYNSVKDINESEKDILKQVNLPLTYYHAAFGYNKDILDMIIQSNSKTGKETVYSMGADTPLAVFSHTPKRLFDYFKQRFTKYRIRHWIVFVNHFT